MTLDWRLLVAGLLVAWLLGRRARRRRSYAAAAAAWSPPPAAAPAVPVGVAARRVVLAAALISASLLGVVLAANGAGAGGGPNFAGVLDGLVAGAGRIELPKLTTPGKPAGTSGRACPVAGAVHFGDSWHAPRAGHLHQGVDMMAKAGTPLVAVETGRIGKVGYAGIGGLRVWLHGKSGTSYYYAHLQSAAVQPGQRVKVGERVGRVGSSGNASADAPHLHFQRHPHGGAPVNPYPAVKAWCR